GDQVVDCNEGAAGTSIMSHARGVLYGGQTPVGNETLPQGIGLRTSASEVLIFQVHYLNASASDLAATVNASLTLDSNPADITTQAGLIFFYDPFIDVPPGATAKATMRCPIPSDITLLYGSSHYHARGSNYGAYLDTAGSPPSTTPFYTSNSWSSPPNQQMQLKVAAGTRLRFECDYDNTSGTLEYFQGPSAQTNEMCMFIGLYYPEMGQPADFCISDQDMFGNGTAKCSDTLTCLQACGGKLSVGGLGGSLPPCEQKCFVQSCPTATAPLMPLVSCIKSSCSTQCDGTSASACSACVGSSCGSQYTTCSSHTCN
ncbi:MAG TPA: hypothetical protein VIF15_20075, partial [Polyangiaceae bacterium]